MEAALNYSKIVNPSTYFSEFHYDLPLLRSNSLRGGTSPLQGAGKDARHVILGSRMLFLFTLHSSCSLLWSSSIEARTILLQVATTLSLRDGSSDNDQSSDNFMTRSL